MMGGALRFLQELDGYLGRQPDGICTIGRGRRVSGRWLAEREFRALRCGHTVALNNIAFARAGNVKTVLLRNALHFLSNEERPLVAVGRGVRAQTAVVHRMLRRADRIVVPTTSMAARVTTIQPGVAGRIRVMHHPVSPRPACQRRASVLLCPVLDAPYKMLGPRLAQVVQVMEDGRGGGSLDGLELLLTLTREEAAALDLRLPSWVCLLGRLTPRELYTAQQSAQVILYPTTLESFGYPLAEARLARQPVIAPYTDHAREVADDALVGYDPSDSASLAGAIGRALELQLGPLTENPFDPDAYFDRLFSAA